MGVGVAPASEKFLPADPSFRCDILPLLFPWVTRYVHVEIQPMLQSSAQTLAPAVIGSCLSHGLYLGRLSR